MIFLFDTSALVNAAHFYLPFDGNRYLESHLNEGLTGGSILLLDKVITECKRVRQGVVIDSFPSIEAFAIDTNSLSPNKRFFNLAANQFSDKDIQKLQDLTSSDFEAAYLQFLKTADARLLLYVLQHNSGDGAPTFTIVTDESASANDRKLFKKIPSCCQILGIPCMNITQYLIEHSGLDISIVGQATA